MKKKNFLLLLAIIPLLLIFGSLFTFDQALPDDLDLKQPERLVTEDVIINEEIEIPSSELNDTTDKEIEAKQVIVSDSSKERSSEEVDDVKEEKEVVASEFKFNPNPYKAYIERNSDFIGWIRLENTKVDYPIVKASDNDYYLNRNFDKQYDKNGSIYMDYRNFGFGFDRHTIIYGHNMKDGSMFGELKKYKDESFALEHTIITIEDLYKTRTYRVVSSYFSKADSSIIQTQFDDISYGDYINRIIAQSQINYGITPIIDDDLLTLVTCTYEVDDGRYIIHAIDITEEEDII